MNLYLLFDELRSGNGDYHSDIVIGAFESNQLAKDAARRYVDDRFQNSLFYRVEEYEYGEDNWSIGVASKARNAINHNYYSKKVILNQLIY